MARRLNSIAVFSNKAGVGATSLVYHLAWMYAKLDYNVLVADLDPQAHLTTMFLTDKELEPLWEAPDATIYASLQPLLDGTGNATMPKLVEPTVGLSLAVGDLRLASAEDEVSSQWLASLEGKERALRVLSAIWRSLRLAADHVQADLVLLDPGPNLGALSRAALVAADYVVVPVAPDLHSLHGLRSLGPTLHKWRREWKERRERNPVDDLPMPRGAMRPIGYVVLPHVIRFNKPLHEYDRWIARFPSAYRQHVLQEDITSENPPDADDKHCLATIEPFRSLLPLAYGVRKPMFALKPADGALSGYTGPVAACHRAFRDLAREIAHRCKMPEPSD